MEEDSSHEYDVQLSRRVEKELQGIRDRREQFKLHQQMLALESEPTKLGKQLAGLLQPYRRIRVGRYRVLYSVDEEKRVVTIALIGIRKEGDWGDVYRVADRLADRGWLSTS